jgi:hypothetical protein
MKKIILLLIALLFVSAVSSILIITPETKYENNNAVHIYNLEKGKNYLVFNFTIFRFIYASEIVSNPEIQAISYKENNKTIGYLNAFGGIGKNFQINSDTVYEIITKKEVNLTIET